MANHYEALGLNQRANTDQIKAAFKKLALDNHPDKTQQLPSEERESRQERFKAINNAYEVLSDPARRAVYDKKLGLYAPRKAAKSKPTGHDRREQPPVSPTSGRYPQSDPRTSPQPPPSSPNVKGWEEEIRIPETKFTIISKNREPFTSDLRPRLVTTYKLSRIHPRGAPANLGHPITTNIQHAPGHLEKITVFYKEVGTTITLEITIFTANNLPRKTDWRPEFDLNAVENVSRDGTRALGMALEIWETDCVGDGHGRDKSYEPLDRIRMDEDFVGGTKGSLPEKRLHHYTGCGVLGVRAFIIRAAVAWVKRTGEIHGMG